MPHISGEGINEKDGHFADSIGELVSNALEGFTYLHWYYMPRLGASPGPIYVVFHIDSQDSDYPINLGYRSTQSVTSLAVDIVLTITQAIENDPEDFYRAVQWQTDYVNKQRFNPYFPWMKDDSHE